MMKWLLSILGVLSVGLAAAIAIIGTGRVDENINVMLLDAGFGVAQVKVAGLHFSDEEKLRDLAGIDPSRHIFDQDLNGIRQRVESLPWVKQAAIARHLPDEIHIDVREYRPFAIWQYDGRLRLIDQSGYTIIETGKSAFPELPLVVGRGAAEASEKLVKTLALAPQLATRVKAAIRVGERRWDLKFDNDVILSLPEEAVQQAWQRFAALQSSAQILEQGYTQLDLRLPDMLVVRPKRDSHKQKNGLNVGQRT